MTRYFFIKIDFTQIPGLATEDLGRGDWLTSNDISKIRRMYNCECKFLASLLPVLPSCTFFAFANFVCRSKKVFRFFFNSMISYIFWVKQHGIGVVKH